MPRYDPSPDGERALSPVVGSVLLLVVLLMLAVVVGVIVIDLSRTTPEDAVRLYVDIDETNAGIAIVPETINHPIEIYVNGQSVPWIEPADRYEEILLPVAPNDVVQFVADIGRQQVVKQETIDEHQAGDFIAYYTFEEGSGGTVTDRSPNGNDLTIAGASWVTDGEGTALEFDGDGDFATVDQLNLEEETTVDEFTVAIKYRISGTNDDNEIQQLVEHNYDDENPGFEWFLETRTGIGNGDPDYQVEYSVSPGWDDTKSDDLDVGDVHVVVATYDGEELRLYVDGTLVDTDTQVETVEMGDLFLGADAPNANHQYLNGRIYQFRLYYSAFDDDEVDVLTTIVEAEAE